MNTKKLYKGIDLFKLVAALGVVALHTGIKGLNVLGHLSIPFFVIISSFFFLADCKIKLNTSFKY